MAQETTGKYCPICNGVIIDIVPTCDPPIYTKKCPKCNREWRKSPDIEHKWDLVKGFDGIDESTTFND